MGTILSKTSSPWRTVVITGGSRGMGLAAGRQLAEKGANVVIVARDQEKLLQSLEYIQQGAVNPQTQRFLQISADLTTPSESVRIIDQVQSWNSGNPPDIVWCCAGSSYPTLFIDTPISEFQTQMDSNYFTSLYMAHAILTCWLKTSRKAIDDVRTSNTAPARHLIFTASFVAFYSFAGYSPYSPSKAALRALSDNLSQEMNLYAAAHPNDPPVRLHTVFPATIYTESYEAENRIKSDLTKMLEEGDEGQTPEVVAARSIKGLEICWEVVQEEGFGEF
ncbi:3-ketodihydrosphingosine reductase tsc10 [Daldinia childiae]|uniref:3-ketodihydrosphingosine reductase tsc10 n=1 Tax=Daldinia childiae TaxID=326645 RepID=UPI001444F806|nr:3-ketodihydrosphingosine reductase tsc10 [Daldinia childiae]KAF3064794.1 3-ketodihydrosphingosine reductase tsc10 [Daldinia childiae]